MNDQRRRPDSTSTFQDASLIRDTLGDKLANAADLQGACQIALDYLLQAVGRSSGAILVGALDDTSLEVMSEQELPLEWINQVDGQLSPLDQLAFHVLQSGKLVLKDDVPGDLVLPAGFAVALPVSHKSISMGALLLFGANSSSHEVELLNQLMPALVHDLISRWELLIVQKRASDLATLQMDLARMGFDADAEGIQAKAIQGACRVLDSEVGALALLDGEQDEWLVHKSLNQRSEWVYQVNPASGRGLLRECLRSGQPIRVTSVTEEPRFDLQSDAPEGLTVRSVLCAPLMVNGQLLGVIQVFNRRWGEYSAYDQDLLAMIATLVANAIHGSRLIQQHKLTHADLQASRWELLGSRNTLFALFDGIPSALYIVNQQYELIMVNKSCAYRSGEEPQVLVGNLCYRILYGLEEPCPGCLVGETLAEGKTTHRSASRWGTKEDLFDWEISTYPIFDDDGAIVQAIMLEQDITDKRRLESIVAQSEKLAAIGQLAAGVAHEINNPLTAIIANAQILHRELPPNDDLQESVDLIARAGARATQVVRNLLDFARKEEYHLSLTNLNESLQKALDLIQHELVGRSIRLTFDADPKLPSLLGSQDHLQSVWLNLLLNAIDSIDKTRGEIKITTKSEGDEITISVADNGKGIPAERLQRIFEPFFTTKAPGRGTGLGLSVCHRIVKQHGGHILVDSQVGLGSEFTVVLPIS